MYLIGSRRCVGHTVGRVHALSERTAELALRPIPCAHADVSVEGTATSEEPTVPLVSLKAPTTMSSLAAMTCGNEVEISEGHDSLCDKPMLQN